jgi:hypothetical protein
MFDDATGAVIDLDMRGWAAGGRPPGLTAAAEEHVGVRGRGRPKLGVVAREVTLLPQHWEWLAAQPGGASVTLRKLVHAARAAAAGNNGPVNHAAAYRFMSAMAGNLSGFEEAARALFAGAYDRLAQQMAAWPPDVRAYALRLARG